MLTQEGAALDARALLAPLAGDAAILLAVSGGPDSVALMLLAARWPLRKAREIAVATVDHRLREGSREEAEQTGEWARALGFDHHLLTWEGEKPQTRLQERAREARYGLLADCARRVGASAIVTAHHADDQAETVLFRLTRGSGIAGLAGMSARVELDGAALARPLLAVRKSLLEAECAGAGHPFFRDPANENPAFARARLRALGATLAAQGLDCDALLRLARRAAQADDALAWSAARAQSDALLSRDAQETRFDAKALRDLPQEILQRAIAAEIARLAAPARPRLDALERAAQRISRALSSQSSLKITLAETALRLERGELALRRAPKRRARPGCIGPADEAR